jgi:hypothetical protein
MLSADLCEIIYDLFDSETVVIYNLHNVFILWFVVGNVRISVVSNCRRISDDLIGKNLRGS